MNSPLAKLRVHQWKLTAAMIALFALLGACQPISQESSSTAVTVLRGDGDQRAYRYVELPNRLRVLLISAPNTDKAAAALDINVGSGNDPQDRPGLAHFLEHMLFLGTDKYPKADEYQDFIAAHGGNHNAFTAFEHTNYFFDVDSQFLEPTLDRFSRFFVAPLFSAENVEREKHAVDSEYRANIQNDPHRELDVFRDIVNPAHPFSKFSVGTLDTLADRTDRPVRGDLIEFYRRHYSANLMTLVVLGRESLDDLQHMVTSRFSPVPNFDRRVEPINVPLFEESTLPKFVQIQPMQQQRTLGLAWSLPEQRSDYRAKSLEYIGNILGHEGTGSLLSDLKQRGWAQALSAGRGLDYLGGSQFNINIELTPEGEQHIDAIVQLVYQTIHRIRDGGIVEWLYREQQIVAEQRFRFREIPAPISDVSQLAGNLHDYPAAEVIRGDYLMQQFEHDRIQALIDRMTPQRMLLSLTSPNAKTDRHSKYYATPYSIAGIASDKLLAWQNAGVAPTITLPPPNPFIAEQLPLKPLPPTVQRDAKPTLLQDSGGLHAWFLQDSIYRLPKATIALDIQTSLADDTASNAVKSELFVRMLRENLNEYSYPAALAGLGYQINRGRGISITVQGFDPKQDVLLEQLLKALRQPQFSASTFARVKHEYRRELQDNNKQPPYQLLLDDIGNVLVKSRWPDSEMLKHIDSIDLKQLQQFVPALLAHINVNMLVHGNIVESDARRLAALVQTHLFDGAQPKTPAPVQILQIGNTDVRRTLPAPHDDAALLWYRQAADNQKSTRAALGVSAQIIGADFYAQLRTRQQLGYIVMSSVYPVRDVPGLIFVAQSPVASPAQLAVAYREFLSQWSQRDEQQLRALFERHRSALAQRLAEQPKNLGEASDRLWQDISSGYLQFDSRQQLLAAVNALTFEQWRALFQRDVLTPTGHAIWLSVNGRFAKDALQQGAPIDNLDRFKAKQEFYSFE